MNVTVGDKPKPWEHPPGRRETLRRAGLSEQSELTAAMIKRADSIPPKMAQRYWWTYILHGEPKPKTRAIRTAKPQPKRRCDGCGMVFLPSRLGQRFHDRQCYRRNRRNDSWDSKGAINETSTQGTGVTDSSTKSLPERSPESLRSGPVKPRICALRNCGREFTPLNGKARYCSGAHRQAAHRERRR